MKALFALSWAQPENVSYVNPMLRRRSQVYRKADRGWRISHAHYSVPATPPPTAGQAAQ